MKNVCGDCLYFWPLADPLHPTKGTCHWDCTHGPKWLIGPQCEDALDQAAVVDSGDDSPCECWVEKLPD